MNIVLKNSINTHKTPVEYEKEDIEQIFYKTTLPVKYRTPHKDENNSYINKGAIFCEKGLSYLFAPKILSIIKKTILSPMQIGLFFESDDFGFEFNIYKGRSMGYCEMIFNKTVPPYGYIVIQIPNKLENGKCLLHTLRPNNNFSISSTYCDSYENIGVVVLDFLEGNIDLMWEEK